MDGCWLVVGICYSFISHIWRVGYRLHRGETYKYKEHIGIEEHHTSIIILFFNIKHSREESIKILNSVKETKTKTTSQTYRT